MRSTRLTGWPPAPAPTSPARVPLSVIGMLQYLTPVLQFCAALVLGETMPASRWIGFGLVWLALAVLTADALHRQRRARPWEPAASRP